MVAARAKVRRKLFPAGPTPPKDVSVLHHALGSANASPPRERYFCWAELLKRTQRVDALRCTLCGGKMQLIAFVTDPDVAAEVLQRLGLAPPTASLH